jgi:NTE family protein
MSPEQWTASDHGAQTSEMAMRFGLVLGAGGALAWVYHLGVIEGLRDAGFVEPSRAGRVVGTSAGAAVGAALLAGATTDQFLAALAASPTSDFPRMILDARTRARVERQTREGAGELPPASSPADAVLRRFGLIPLLPGPAVADALATLPIGSSHVWDERLWVTAVRVRDGATVVFGRDRSDLTPAAGIEASCAMPLVFQPKVIGNDSYVDGAVTSPTHADLLADDGHEVVIVSAPMSRAGGGWRRERARGRMERETALLRRAGCRTLVLVPDDAVIREARGYPVRRREARRLIVEAAQRQTREELRRVDWGSAPH